MSPGSFIYPLCNLGQLLNLSVHFLIWGNNDTRPHGDFPGITVENGSKHQYPSPRRGPGGNIRPLSPPHPHPSNCHVPATGRPAGTQPLAAWQVLQTLLAATSTFLHSQQRLPVPASGMR